MSTFVRAPPPRPLGTSESLESLTPWETTFRTYFKRDDAYKPLVRKTKTWEPSAPNYGQVEETTGLNPIPRGLWYNLFHAGGGAYMPPLWFLGKKKVFAQFLLHTLRATKNRVTHQKAGLYLKKKQNNGGRFKIAVCNMTGRISSIFCIFYLFALKWL